MVGWGVTRSHDLESDAARAEPRRKTRPSRAGEGSVVMELVGLLSMVIFAGRPRFLTATFFVGDSTSTSAAAATRGGERDEVGGCGKGSSWDSDDAEVRSVKVDDCRTIDVLVFRATLNDEDDRAAALVGVTAGD